MARIGHPKGFHFRRFDIVRIVRKSHLRMSWPDEMDYILDKTGIITLVEIPGEKFQIHVDNGRGTWWIDVESIEMEWDPSRIQLYQRYQDAQQVPSQ